MSCASCVHCRALDAAESEMGDLDLAVKIVDILSERYHIKATSIRGPFRTQHIAFVRMIGMYLTRRLTKWTYHAIADFYHRDHSTIVHGYNKIAAMIITRPVFNFEIQRLIKELSDNRHESNRAA